MLLFGIGVAVVLLLCLGGVVLLQRRGAAGGGDRARRALSSAAQDLMPVEPRKPAAAKPRPAAPSIQSSQPTPKPRQPVAEARPFGTSSPKSLEAEGFHEPTVLRPRPLPLETRRELVAATQTVLVVDDSPLMQRSLEELFRKAGYKVFCAGDGQGAVSWVKTNGMPAMITLDLEMPGLDGIQTLKALQQIPADRPMQAVFVTGKGPRLKETHGELGAAGYFSKPYDGPALLALASRVAPLTGSASARASH